MTLPLRSHKSQRHTTMQRWCAKVRLPAAPEGCWQWIGGANVNGYGRFGLGRRMVLAYRYGYERFIGPIPDGLTIDHLCRNRACVNPAHLEPVPLRENILRGTSPPAQQARQTHCKRGHSLAGANLYVTPDNDRRCRTCKRQRDRMNDAPAKH